MSRSEFFINSFQKHASLQFLDPFKDSIMKNSLQKVRLFEFGKGEGRRRVTEKKYKKNLMASVGTQYF